MVEFRIDNSSRLHREIKQLVTMACGRWSESTELVSKDTTDRIMAAVNDALVRNIRESEMRQRQIAQTTMSLEIIEELKGPLEKLKNIPYPHKKSEFFGQFPVLESSSVPVGEIRIAADCPECRALKHWNCPEITMDYQDNTVPCPCFLRNHERTDYSQ